MKTKKHIKSACLCIILFLCSCGQIKNYQKQSFVQELNNMLARADDGTYSDEVMQSVFELIKNNPQSIDYEFMEDDISHVRVTTSDDGNVRTYNLERYGFEGPPSWRLDCKTLLQYRSGENVYYNEVESFVGYITYIHHIDSNKFYLFEDFQKDVYQGIHESYTLSVYKIEEDKIHKVNEAFVDRNNVFNHLEISWKDWGGHLVMDYEKKDTVFIYNKYQKEIFVIKETPLAGRLFKYRQYCWNGKKFEILKFDEPEEFENPKYFIRIEQQSEDAWIYKCWNGGVKKGEPDLVLSGTKQYWLYDTVISCDEWWTDDASTPLGNKYTFCNNGYRYEFYYGWDRGKQHETLYVYDPDENMIYYGDFTPLDKP